MVLEKLDASHWGESRSTLPLSFYWLILFSQVHSERYGRLLDLRC